MPDDTTPDARARLADALWNDPEAGPKFRALVAEKYPQAKSMMPDLVLREQNQKELDLIRAEREADRKERAEDRRQMDLERARRSVLEDNRLRVTPTDIEPIEKLMIDEGIGTHRAAAEVYRARQAAAGPQDRIGGYAGAMQVPGHRGAGGDYFKGIIEDPDSWAREKSQEILHDFANGRGDRWMA